ncbi:neuronal acetylcholine receptor subunit alpha-5-like [Cydia splendana]|uniref:neuronal acetylcholine receptor subunit alpha-5-like n=1 Tax=Cydia splendana TaxID=1100963 RepID=UPI00300C18F1
MLQQWQAECVPAGDQSSNRTRPRMFPRAYPVRALALWACVLLARADTDDCPNKKEQVTEDARLRKDLKCAYNSDYRPVLQHQDTVNVEVGFLLKYISFDYLEETFTVHSWVTMTWKDEFLKWKPSDYGGINMTLLESHEIWTPRLALFNADASRYQSDSFYTTCKVRYNGSVTCVPHMAHSGICRTTLRRWPYDAQNCTLYFGSWMHTGEQINFTFDAVHAVNTDEYQDGPGWRLLHVAKKRFPGKYSCCPNDTYPMLKYTFVMQREAAGPAAIVVVPSIAIVMLTLISLMLDIKDNTRLIVACFSLFCHFIFLTEIGYDIPKESADTPIILLFIRDSMVVSLFAVLLTLGLMSLRTRATPPPTWLLRVTRFVAAGPVKYAVFTEFDPDRAPDEKVTLSEDDAGTSAVEEPKQVSSWLQLSNIMNSAVFIVSLITYAVLLGVYIPRDPY